MLKIGIWTSTCIFCTYHILASADTVELNSGLSLNLHLFLGMKAAMTLANLHTSLCHIGISTKIKCAGLFDLFLTKNQAILGML